MRIPLSRTEAIVWRTRNDPILRMTTSNLVVLDRAPPRAALLERLAEAALANPRLRERPEERLSLAGRLLWVEDPAFDPDNHLHSIALPSPCETREALDLISLLEPSPFDPARPPWDVTLVDGLAGGGAALFVRAQQVVGVGRGGMSFLDVLLDEPVWPATLPHDDALDGDGLAAYGRRRRPGTFTVTVDLTSVARPVAAGVTTAMTADPVDVLARGVQRTLDVAGSVTRQVAGARTRLSPLPPSRAVTNRFAAISVPGARTAALALGGSRRDLLVAASSAALGSYHRRMGLPCPVLRAALPTSRHSDVALGVNWFAPTLVEVPTDPEHPSPHFGVVTDRIAQARSEPAARVVTMLTSAMSRAPMPIVVPALRAHAASIDFTSTALQGLRGTRHICGSAIEASYPFGPRLGSLMNATAFGNDDRIDVGLAFDPVDIADPDLLVACMAEAFGGLVVADATVSASHVEPVPVSAMPPAAQR